MSENTSVKYFNSQMYRAPEIKGNDAHCVRDLMEACLVTGFGDVTANSAVVSGGVCKITFNKGESFSNYSTVFISGATNKTSVNGEHKVKRASTTWIEIDAPGESNGVVDGSISVKYASAGWELAFPRTTNDAVFRSQAESSDKYYIRFTYNNYQCEQIRCYTEMSDNTTGVGETTVRYCPKSYDNNATAKQWTLIANESFFTFVVMPRYAYPSMDQGHAATQFGDFIPEYPSGVLDGCKTMSWAQHSVNRAYGSENSDYTNLGKNYIDYGGGECTLLFDFLTGEQNARYGLVAYSGASRINSSRNVPSSNVGPSGVDVRTNSIVLKPYYVTAIEPNLGQIYGRVPGMYFMANDFSGRIRNLQLLDHSGRNYLPVYTGSGSTYLYENQHRSDGYCPVFDITGPWE